MAPYQVSIWQAGYQILGSFPTFPEAIACFALVEDSTKQIVNLDKADSGTSGLTPSQLDAVSALPATRAATLREFAGALSISEAA